jgi:hypothetical protein
MWLKLSTYLATNLKVKVFVEVDFDVTNTATLQKAPGVSPVMTLFHLFIYEQNLI